jgi:zinc transport system substrate-binding protein/iron/zinc/copper transport system substrate-binding protein
LNFLKTDGGMKRPGNGMNPDNFSQKSIYGRGRAMSVSSRIRLSRRLFCCAVLLFAAATLFARGRYDESQPEKPVIVASTSWVAAIAEAAGLENVKILAPAELKHPPEYELKPSDLRMVSQSQVILYAGWEMFAQKLAETADGASVAVIKVNTTNDPDILIGEAQKLAERFGTTAAFEKWRDNFKITTGDLRTKILTAWPDKRAVVQRMQTPFVKWLGFEIIGEYGPAEPSPQVILGLVNLKPALVVDNYHGPSGMPVAEAAKAPYAELINFPGKGGTKTLDDVFRYNADILLKAAPKK